MLTQFPGEKSCLHHPCRTPVSAREGSVKAGPHSSILSLGLPSSSLTEPSPASARLPAQCHPEETELPSFILELLSPSTAAEKKKGLVAGLEQLVVVFPPFYRESLIE